MVDANGWKTLHRKAVERAQWREARYRRVLRQQQQQATLREAALRGELELAQAKIRDLQQRVFGRKSERRKGGSEQRAQSSASSAPRGQRRGAPGHGRTMLAHLPERTEFVELDSPQCPNCGEPLERALVSKLRSELHWHADETRWAVFVQIEGKVGHRWYLWVFHSRSVVHYVLDESRSAAVVEAELAGVQRGIISCDRYSAYKKFARLHPGVVRAFCWAHQRRDYLELANAYPDLSRWAMGWVDAIAELYHLNSMRLQAQEGSTERSTRESARDSALRQAVQRMLSQRGTELADPKLAEPAAKVLQSMQNHWAGLTVFVEHPWVPMDNNVAERAVRTPVVGRKNFYGSGSLWSGQFAATMYSLLMTAKLCKLNARTWLSAYLQACADAGNHAPAEINAFLPWAMDAQRLAAMRACPLSPQRVLPEGIHSS